MSMLPILDPSFKFAIPHQDIAELSHYHREALQEIFTPHLGVGNLDHIGVGIVSPDKEFTYFSSTPDLISNITERGLLCFDGEFSPTFFEVLTFYEWQAVFDRRLRHTLREVKLEAFGFVYGFTLVRRVQGYHLLYSFATRTQQADLKAYYNANRDALTAIGDQCYPQIRDLHALYAPMPPVLPLDTVPA